MDMVKIDSLVFELEQLSLRPSAELDAVPGCKSCASCGGCTGCGLEPEIG